MICAKPCAAQRKQEQAIHVRVPSACAITLILARAKSQAQQDRAQEPITIILARYNVDKNGRKCRKECAPTIGSAPCCSRGWLQPLPRLPHASFLLLSFLFPFSNLFDFSVTMAVNRNRDRLGGAAPRQGNNQQQRDINNPNNNPNNNNNNDNNNNNNNADPRQWLLFGGPVNIVHVNDPALPPEHFHFDSREEYLLWFLLLGEIKAQASEITRRALELRDAGNDWIPYHHSAFYRWCQFVLAFVNQFGRVRVPRDVKWALRDAEENLGLPVTFPNAAAVGGN